MATRIPIARYLKKIKNIKCLWRRIGDHMSRRQFTFPFGDVFCRRLSVATGDQPNPSLFFYRYFDSDNTKKKRKYDCSRKIVTMILLSVYIVTCLLDDICIPSVSML